MAAGNLTADNKHKLPVSTSREQFKFWEHMLLPAVHSSPKTTSQNPYYTSHLAPSILSLSHFEPENTRSVAKGSGHGTGSHCGIISLDSVFILCFCFVCFCLIFFVLFCFSFEDKSQSLVNDRQVLYH